MLNKLLALEDQLNMFSTNKILQYADVDELSNAVARNRLGNVEIWDDPSLFHGEYKRVVQYNDGSIHKQRGIDAPPTLTLHEHFHDEPPTTLTYNQPKTKD